jgi:hypothetical protein
VNKGIEILLARMDSHPEEFAFDSPIGRWEWVWRNLQRGELTFLSEEEIAAFKRKLDSVQGESFTRTIMRELLMPEEKNKPKQ